MTRAEAFALVDQARNEAEQFRIYGQLEWTSASPDCPPEMWLAALVEELGEVARCVHDGANDDRLAEELAHLAGVAVGRLETLSPDKERNLKRMTLGLLICAILFLSTLVGGKAWAQIPSSGDRVSPSELRAEVGQTRRATNRVRARKCMAAYRFKYAPMFNYPTRLLKAGLLTWQPRLRHARAAKSRCARIHHLQLWLCVHRHEGRWDDPNDPYFGGLQMSRWFMKTYGAKLYATKGTADHWTPREQMGVADRAYHSEGHSSGWLNGQWPGTRQECGA